MESITISATLRQTRVEGVKTNIPFLLKALASPQFRRGRYTTRLADSLTAGVVSTRGRRNQASRRTGAKPRYGVRP